MRPTALRPSFVPARWTTLCGLAILTLPVLASAAPAELATLGTARWLEPATNQDGAPNASVTTLTSPLGAVTKLPPADEIHDDVTLVIELTLDTTSGLDAPLVFRTRSDVIEVQPPEHLENGRIQPAAVDGTTATLHVAVRAKNEKLRILQPVYHEEVTIVLPGRAARSLQWVFKPWGKHDQR